MHTLKFLGQLGILWIIYYLSTLLVTTFDLPIPANVIGVIALFCMLCFGIIKVEYVADAADFFLRHLVFFFIPIAVGLMEWGGVFYDYGIVLLIAIIVSSVTPLLTVGFLTVTLHRKHP